MSTEDPHHIARLVGARTGDVLDLGDHRTFLILSPSEIASDFLLVEAEVDPGGGPPRHLHSREDETFIIRAGRFAIQVGHETMEAGLGDTLFGALFRRQRFMALCQAAFKGSF